MVDINSPIVKEFLIESFENLSNISEELTHFEKNSGDKELLNSIYRKVHTLKGSASFLGLKKLQEITHVSENLLDKVRDSKLKVTPGLVDTLLDSFDTCLKILNSIESTGEEGTDSFSDLLNKLNTLDRDGEISSDVKVPNIVLNTKKDLVVEKKESLVSKKIEKETQNNHKSENPTSAEADGLDALSALSELESQIFDRNKRKTETKSSGTAASKPVEINSANNPVKIPVKDAEKSAPKVIEKIQDAAAEKTKKIEVSLQENNSVDKNLLNNLKEKYNNSSDEKQENEKVKIKAEESQTTSSSNLIDSVVRVNVGLLDKIMNIVGELVLNRNQILQYANNDASPELSRLAHQLNTITTELQTDIMTTRMQPVGSVLSKFERVVRDIARQQEKNIRLTISGKETELDKTLLEAIRDPLTHLIRNAVDHGIEIPNKRLEKGKSDTGTIAIRAYHEGGQVTIEISDDGNGIDPEKIINKAISKGIITPEKAKNLSKKQAFSIIFAPGFSTAEQVTNISGRGVGMDVVKSNIEKIGGSVDVSSQVGEGTVFKLKIPLTLAIVPALVVQSEGDTFAIPQISLVELVRIEEGDDKKIELIHDSEFFRLRGSLIPVFRLNEVLKISDKPINRNEANIVILNAEGFVYGLVVDQILDTEEIVVKPLSKELKDLSIYGGATIMGDGSVSLIVDALGFLNTMNKTNNQKRVDQPEINEEKNFVYNDEILLCKLADKRTYGMPLILVNRLEEFNASEIEWSGKNPLIRYRDKAMPLISLEKAIGLSQQSILETGADIIPAVVVTIRGHQLGLVVSEIRDIAVNTSQISTDTADRDQFVGTAYINEKTVTILDVFNIVDSLPLKKSINVKKKSEILIVEDSELYLRVQRELFLEAGYHVFTAANGLEALDIMKRNRCHAVVTDIDMPEMNGWDLLKQLKNDAKFKDLPVIAVSSIVERRKEDVMRAGFDFCFDKQNNFKALEVLNELLE